MCDVVVQEEIIHILLSNWVVQAELGEYVSQYVGDFESCQVALVSPIELSEEGLDSDVDGSGSV